MNSHAYTVENIMSTFPDVLRHDPQMLAMGKTIATLMVRYRADLESALHILTNIDNLPEDVLDSLAYDFKVDWYNYDYPVNVKRALLKTSPYVHRHLGTRAAVETAVRALYPDSILEEWFEYGADPYHFRILADINSPQAAVDHGELLWAVYFYKSLRSRPDGVFYRSHVTFCIRCTAGWTAYSGRLCGTYPYAAKHGFINREGIEIETAAHGAGYTSPLTDMLDAGTYPAPATYGDISHEGIGVKVDAQGAGYAAPRTDTLDAGTHPGISRYGEISAAGVDVAVSAEGYTHGSTPAGIVPGIATEGSIEAGGFHATADGFGFGYNAPLCGSTPGSL